jgi:hypothetical protein
MPVRAQAILEDPNLVTLPKSQWNRVQQVRGKLLDHLADAVADMGLDLEADVRTAIKAIKRGGYKDRVIKREVRKLMRTHYDRLGKAVAGQVEHAATLATRYAETVETFALTGRAVKPLSHSYPSRIIREGRAGARIALSPEVLLSQPAPRLTPRYVADRVMQREVPMWKDARVLSSKLHGRGVKASREIQTQVIAAVKESKQLTEASTSLIRAVRATGKGELGRGPQLSGLMKRVEKAGEALNRRGSPADLKEWQTVRRLMEKKVARLADGGRVQNSLIEILQTTKKDSAKGITRCIKHHANDVQKYKAERIIKSETMAAYKADQVLLDQKHDFVVGYIWRMNRAARSGFVKRRTSKSGRIIGAKRYRRGGRRRRCVCEELNGKRLSVEMVRGRTARLIAHPHCMCYLDPVMDKRRLDVAQPEDFF